jgi:hypothetical protein
MTASTAETTVLRTLQIRDDWTPEQQLAQMLGLCEAQMDSAIVESDQSVDVLVQAFTALAETTRAVGAVSASLSAMTPGKESQALQEQLALLSKQTAAAVVAFQFYDKLTQRLGHVRYSLSALALFVCNRAQMQQPEHWDRLNATLRRLYRTEAEREVFHSVMDGGESAIVDASATAIFPRQSMAAGEIELF